MYDETIARGFSEPKSLEEWGSLTYFECNLPWMNVKDRTILENLAFITRFVFWHREIKARYLRTYYYPFYYLLRLDALIRWRLRWFTSAPEWGLFRRFVQGVGE